MESINRVVNSLLTSPRVRVVAAILALVVLATAFLGRPPLWEPDEGRYVAVSLEMLRLDDFMVPHLHHEHEHLTKPPLTYWLVAGSLALFGHHEGAARLPSAGAFVLTVILVWGISRRVLPDRSWLPPVVYATSLLPFAAANLTNTDSLLTLWETLAAFAFVEVVFGRETRWRRELLLLMWIAFGLGFFTKGYPALLPLPAMLAFLAATGGWSAVRRLFTVPGMVAFVVIGLWWYALLVAMRPELLGTFVGGEVVARLTTDRYNRNAQWYGGFKVYGTSLLLGSLPWIAPLLRGLRRLPALARLEHWRRWRSTEQETLLLVLWVVLPLALLMLSRSRSHLYVLPLFVPLSILLARRVRGWLGSHPGRLAVGVTVWAVALVCLRVVGPSLSDRSDISHVAREVRSLAPGAIDEVLLLSQRNRYGLAFYLGCEVEHLAMVPAEIGGPEPDYREQTLTEELDDETENGRVLLVELRREDEMRRVLGPDAGRRLVRLGETPDFAVYRVVERSDAAGPAPG